MKEVWNKPVWSSLILHPLSFILPLPPLVVIGKGVDGPGQLGFGQRLQRLLRQAQVLPGGDLQIDRRARHHASPAGPAARPIGRRRWPQSPPAAHRRPGAVGGERPGASALPRGHRGGRSLRSCPPPTRFNVPATGVAKIAAPVRSAAAKISSIQASARQGRAASWTQTKSASGFTRAKAAATESARSAPRRPLRCREWSRWKRSGS